MKVAKFTKCMVEYSHKRWEGWVNIGDMSILLAHSSHSVFTFQIQYDENI